MPTNQCQKMEAVFIKLKKDMVGLFGIHKEKELMFGLFTANLNKVSIGAGCLLCLPLTFTAKINVAT